MTNHPMFEKTVDRLEDAISGAIKDSSVETPFYDGQTPMESHKWYRIHLPEGLSGDGSEYHIYIKKGSNPQSGPLCLFFSGGGIAYDAKTAGSPATGGRIMTGDGGYYWNNLRPITQMMNIGAGITDLKWQRNPFYDWNFIVVTYSTGDFHIGDSTYVFTDDEGEERILHFHGHRNFTEAMDVTMEHFPNPGRLLIAGDSAGGFAVLALSGSICRDYYDKCDRVTVFSDSAFMEKGDWSHTIKELWKAPPDITSDIKSTCLTTEWYKSLYDDIGDRARYLFACSPRDYLLSSFRNDIRNGEFRTDPEIQREYRSACKSMLGRLKQINPETGIFTYNWKNVIYPGNGTVHTAVRTPFFYVPAMKKVPLSAWLMSHIS